MSQLNANTTKQEERLEILTKGMVQLPRKWRAALDLKNGDFVRIKKDGTKLIIETKAMKIAYADTLPTSGISNETKRKLKQSLQTNQDFYTTVAQEWKEAESIQWPK